jgi:hypothetical protein
MKPNGDREPINRRLGSKHVRASTTAEEMCEEKGDRSIDTSGCTRERAP